MDHIVSRQPTVKWLDGPYNALLSLLLYFKQVFHFQ